MTEQHTVPGAVLRAPFVSRTRREYAYMWATVVPAVPAFVLVLVSLVAGGLSLVAIGLPLLMACLAAARHSTSLLRRQARALLGWDWTPPPSRSGSLLRDREAWGSLAYCAVKLPVTLVAVVAGGMVLFAAVLGLTASLWWPVSHSAFGLYDGLSWPATLVLALQAAVVLLALPWLLHLLVAVEKAVVFALVVPRNGSERIAALEAVATHEPDLVVADVRMPPTHTNEGILAAIAIRREHPRVAVLVLSQWVEVTYARQLLTANPGKIGYLLKDPVMRSHDFVEAARRVASGGTALDPDVVRALLAGPAADKGLRRLTERERGVLELLAEGRSNQGIAPGLHLATRTVEKVISAIFAKLDLTDDTSDHRRVLAVLRYLDAGSC